MPKMLLKVEKIIGANESVSSSKYVFRLAPACPPPLLTQMQGMWKHRSGINLVTGPRGKLQGIPKGVNQDQHNFY